jgi:hypothetical protein
MYVRKNCAFVLNKLRETIFSEEIILKYKNNPTDFTRNRKQPFGQMLVFMLNLVKKSLVIEIDNFVQFLKLKTDLKEINDFTNSAFVQRRMKINPEVFKHLSAVIIENTYLESNTTIKYFKGFRLLAVDGSKVTLPYHEKLKEAFGESKNNTNTTIVQGRASILYDVLNHIALDSVLENLKIGERELALKHSFRWEKNDLIIYDRGYPSYDFKYEHIKKEVDYVMRVNLTHSKDVIAFVSSGKKSLTIEIAPPERHCFKDKDYNKNTLIKVRLVRVELPNGAVEVLMTSLFDSQKYPSTMFKELYFLRWGIETYYDELKNKIKLEYFTGYSKTSVLQDFFCAVFISNLQSTIVNDLQQELEFKNTNTKLDYKINTNLSYGFLKNRVLELLFKEGDLEAILLDLETLFLKNTIPIRPGRNNSRNVGKYRNRIRPFVLKNQKDAI